MLRKRLLFLFGCIVTLLLVMGVGVVLLLQNVVGQLNSVSSDTIGGVAAVSAMQASTGALRNELDLTDDAGQPFEATRWDQMLGQIDKDLAELRGVGDLEPTANHVRSELPTLLVQIQGLRGGLTGQATTERLAAYATAIRTLKAIRDRLDTIQTALRTHTEANLRTAISGLQTLALWLGLGFVVVLNVSVIFLSRIAGMILKPIDRLVEASRRLAREEFDHRVEVIGPDEFGELARAYNSLAAQLQANEQRKIETLHQVARTLNHELNNAISIIQLQLALATRGSNAGALEAGRLREMQQALSRMTGTVASLTRVRRIVLTDYLSGVKMLDLEASVAESLPAPAPHELPLQSSR